MPATILHKESLEWAFKDAVTKNNMGKVFVVFFDGNSIKKINDTYDHLMGDFVIEQIASTLTDNVRERDYVVRFGGDEFVLIMPNFDETKVKTFIQRIQQKIRENPSLLTKVGMVTVSAGIMMYDEQKHKNLADVLADADKLMYAAKKNPPYFLKMYNDPIGTENFKSTRRSDAYGVRSRSLFNWVVSQVVQENPGFKLEGVVNSARTVWGTNGAIKVLQTACVNELIFMVRSLYKPIEPTPPMPRLALVDTSKVIQLNKKGNA